MNLDKYLESRWVTSFSFFAAVFSLRKILNKQRRITKQTIFTKSPKNRSASLNRPEFYQSTEMNKTLRYQSKIKRQDSRRTLAQSALYILTVPFLLTLGILACDRCLNTMCLKCIRSYEKRYMLSSQNMKCPFCNSETCNFVDYEKEERKYFDSTECKKMQGSKEDFTVSE